MLRDGGKGNSSLTMKKKSCESTPPLQKRLFTLKEAAAYLGRSEWSMRELIWAGAIPVVKPEGSRKIFVDVQDLNQFIDRNKTVYS